MTALHPRMMFYVAGDAQLIMVFTAVADPSRPTFKGRKSVQYLTSTPVWHASMVR